MIKKRETTMFVACAILALLIACGSVWDHQISIALYQGELPTENFFGVLFAFIGILPSFAGWSFLGASVWVLAKKNVRFLPGRIGLRSLSVLLFVFSFFFLCDTLKSVNEYAFEVSGVLAYSIGTVMVVAAAYWGGRLARRSENSKLLKTVLFLVVVSLIMTIILLTIKDVMSRPRYRWVLAEQDLSYYRTWWEGGRDIRASLGEAAIRDNFSSFPSGHSAYAMFAIFLFPALADYLPRLEKHRKLLFICGFVWWALTALSRITVGAHYLTDVCFGGLLTIVCHEVLYWICRLFAARKK